MSHKIPAIVRFVEKIDHQAACWYWQGAIDPTGYGRFHNDGTMQYAHRWIYEHTFGPIPEGLDIDHLCRIRYCVNPTHLEAVTRRTNLLRGETIAAALADKTECVRGHQFDEANTLILENGTRQCRACNRLRTAKHVGHQWAADELDRLRTEQVAS